MRELYTTEPDLCENTGHKPGQRRTETVLCIMETETMGNTALHFGLPELHIFKHL